MIQAEVINKIKFPNITLQEDLEVIARDIIIPDIVRGIDDGMSVTGGVLPANDPKTIKRKGHGRPLIDTGELRRSFFYKLQGKSKVVVTIEPIRKAIGGYLQNDGIRTNSGLKFYRFFGISQYAFDTAMAYARKRIGEMTHGSKR